MKRIISVALAVIFAFGIIPFFSLNTADAYQKENNCGLGLSWYVDTVSGVLNISGRGRTFEYKSGQAPWDKYASDITSIVVSEGVTHLLSGTFDKLTKAVSLTLPSTVEAIETTADMPALENVTIPEKSDLHYVIQSFADNSPWYHSHSDGSLIYIGTCLLGYKGNLPEDMTSLTIPEGTTAVNASAFMGQTQITEISFPESLIYIGYHAFGNTGWYNAQPDGLVYAGNVLYRWKGAMNSGDTVISLRHGTKGIAEYAFSAESAVISNDKISAVTIPSTVEEIGESAFNGCDDLLRVTFEDGCSLRKIHDSAFLQCDMTSFTVPETVVEIGDNAFGSTKLRNIYIPAGVLMLDGAFESVSSLDRFEVAPDNPNYCTDASGVLFNKDKTVLLSYPGGNRREEYTVPKGVLYIADCAFAGSKLRKLTLNDELEATGTVLFSNSNIIDLDFGAGLETIRYQLFLNTNLEKLVIPENIGTIEHRAFDIRPFTDIYFLNKNVTFEGDSVYSSSCKKKIVFHCYADSTAQKHAEEFGINYVLFDDEPYTAVIDELIAKAQGVYRPNYSAESLANLDAVLAKINLQAENLTQNQIDEWCKELEKALNDLAEKTADFTKVDEAIKTAQAVDRSLYTEESLDALDSAVGAVDRTVTDADTVEAYAKAIYGALKNLEYLPADYSAVNFEIRKAEALDRRCYSEISLIALDTAVNAVEYGLNITEQARVDAFVKPIADALSALQYASVVLRHEPCGVIVSATAKEIKPDTVLAVEEVDSSDYEGTNFAVGGSIRSLHFYDINLVYEAEVVQPDGTVTVKIRLADGVDPSKCKVYHVTEDIVNPLVRFASTIDGNYIVFETGHFSEFAVIEVETVLDGIEITSAPARTEYNSGETFDLTGLKVVADFSDGTSREIDGYVVGMVDMQTPGTKTVTVYYTYGNVTKSAQFNVTVIGKTVSDIAIRKPSVTAVNYGDRIILHADINGDLPEGYRIEWSASNGNFSIEVSADGQTCTVTPDKKGDTTFTATLYDAEGNVVSADEQVMTSKAGIFDKIIAFFKKLFGLSKTIPQYFKHTA